MSLEAIKAKLCDPKHLESLETAFHLQKVGGFNMMTDELGLDVAELVVRVFTNMYDDLYNHPNTEEIELDAVERLKQQVVKEQRYDIAEWLRNHGVNIDY